MPLPVGIRPVFGRTTGLGNKLFPYARAFFQARRDGGVLLEPSWFSPRRGPALREGRLLGGLSAMGFLGKVCLFDNFVSAGPTITVGSEIKVEGVGGYFADLRGSSTELMAHLRSRATARVRREVGGSSSPIVINVRLGRDFRKATSAAEFKTAGALRSPIEFYLEGLAKARDALGSATPAAVVSDGEDGELKALLDVPGVTRFRSTRALSDLIYSANAKYIVGTGGSSFTAWAAYLAQADVLTIAGQSLSWFDLDKATTRRVMTL